MAGGLYPSKRVQDLAVRLALLGTWLLCLERGARLAGEIPVDESFAQEAPGDAVRVGQWSGLSGWPAVTHAALLESGKVMVWSDSSTVRIWDPSTGELATVADAPTDIAGAGHVTQADGTPMIIGGRSHMPGSWGTPDLNLFDPATRTWTAGPVMHRLRWRPTGTVLADGRVLVTGGSDICATCDVPMAEVYNPRTLAWTLLDGVNATIPKSPFMFVVPDGRVLLAGSAESATTAQALDVATGAWTSVDSQVVDGGSAVTYSPGWIMKSGTASANARTGPAARTTYVLDMNEPVPTWQPAGPMTYPRASHNLTLLPDGGVVVTGGETGTEGGSPSRAVLSAEIWSPATGLWTTAAAMQTPRPSESIALLLSDGRVLVAGAGRGGPGQAAAEIFAPPYLFKGPRPRLTTVPATLEYNRDAIVITPDSDEIASVALVRAGSVTHSFNQDQRFVPLDFQRISGGLTITPPSSANIAPPGTYLLFVLNGRGVPSVGAFLRVQPAMATPSVSSTAVAPVAAGPTAAVTTSGLTIDVVVWGDQSSTAATTVTTNVFSTTAANELLLAFVSAGSTSSFGTNTSVTSVTGAGLTWQLVVRTNVQRGTAEIWRTFATAPLANVAVTARTSRSTTSSLSVVSFVGADTTATWGSGAIGAIKSANATSGAPTAALITTRNNSWVFGVGSDRDAAIARTLGLNQALVHQYLPASSGDSYWVQRANAPAPVSGTSVTINDTAPTGDRYNLSLVEILPPDTTPPTVAGVTPANGAANVMPAATVTATFSEPMAAATITTATMVLRDLNDAAVPSTVAYNATTRTATLTPVGPLLNTMTYTATIAGGGTGVTDVVGNALAADVVWSFSIPADTTPPTVTSVTPASGATNVGTTSPVAVTFSEAMTVGTITTATVFLRAPGNVAVAATVAYDPVTRVATLTPTSPLGWTTVYTATVKGGLSGVQDATGIPLANDFVWPFLTDRERIPPAVTGMTPANGATGVPRTTTVTVTFSEAMNAVTVTPTTILLRMDDSLVLTTVDYDAATLTATLTPQSELVHAAIYWVTVVGGENGATDLAGNSVATDVTWSFTTPSDTAPPSVSITSPLNGSLVSGTVIVRMDAADNAAVAGVQFVLDGVTVGNATGRLAWDVLAPDVATANGYAYRLYRDGGASGTPLVGVACVAGPDVTTHVCSVDLGALAPTLHSVRVSIVDENEESVRSLTFPLTSVPHWFEWNTRAETAPNHTLKAIAVDPAGNSTTATPITVTIDNDRPALVGVTPASGAVNVALATTITATFSEAVLASTVNASTFSLRDPVNASIAAAVSYDASTRTARLVPAGVLQNGTTYTATVKGDPGGVTDAAGNPLITDTTWTFSTVPDTTPPLVTGVAPANGATNIALSTAVTATFSEAMAAATMSTATVVLRDPNNATLGANVVYTAPTRTVTLTPTAPLANSTTYTAAVLAGVTDTAGNALGNDVTWTFVTAADTTPPTVTAVTPPGGATNIAPSATVTGTFSEAMAAGTISAASVLLRDASNTPTAASVTYNASARTVTLAPSAALSSAMTYTATLKGGATGVKDVAGNALSSDYVWAFTTAADVIPPTVTASTPANGATGAGTATTVTGTFSEAMTPSTISATTMLLRDPTNATVAATVIYDAATRTATLTPTAALANSTAYTATVKSGATGVKDAAGNALATDYVWVFTTAADSAPPTVIGVTPADGAIGVATTASMTATFSEPMAASSIGPTTVVLRDPVGTAIAATLVYGQATRTVTLTPVAPLVNTTSYTFTVKGGPGGVTDGAGNPLASDLTSTFTTSADSSPPTVTGVTPAAGAIGVVTTTAVTGVFSEPMASSTIGPTTVLLRDPVNTTVAATVTYDTATRTASLTPTASLLYSTIYTATIKGGAAGVKDAAGNALVSDYVWSFTTGADSTPPTVTAVTPADGATAVPTTTAVTGTFSEPMTAATIGAATVTLRDPLNATVTAAVSYSATTRTATLTPATALASSTTYTATVKSGATGVKDTAGNALVTDHVWAFTTAVDTTPPSVTGVTPVAGATGVATTAKVTAIFNEAMAAASIDAATVLLRDSAGTLVAATVAYSAATRTVTLTPTASLLYTMTYTATVKSGATGVKDAAGNPLAADYSWTFATPACPCSLWTASTTPGPVANDTSAVELGMKFRSDVSGLVTGIRFYKYSTNTGTHVGSLWTTSGTLLGSVTFTNETASGWQQATFANPIAVTANTTYIVSYHTNAGWYAYTASGLANAVDKAPLHAPSSASSGGNGVYIYAGNSAFPNQTYNANNYWVDVIFRP